MNSQASYSIFILGHLVSHRQCLTASSPANVTLPSSLQNSKETILIPHTLPVGMAIQSNVLISLNCQELLILFEVQQLGGSSTGSLNPISQRKLPLVCPERAIGLLTRSLFAHIWTGYSSPQRVNDHNDRLHWPYQCRTELAPDRGNGNLTQCATFTQS